MGLMGQQEYWAGTWAFDESIDGLPPLAAAHRLSGSGEIRETKTIDLHITEGEKLRAAESGENGVEVAAVKEHQGAPLPLLPVLSRQLYRQVSIFLPTRARASPTDHSIASNGSLARDFTASVGLRPAYE